MMKNFIQNPDLIMILSQILSICNYLNKRISFSNLILKCKICNTQIQEPVKPVNKCGGFVHSSCLNHYSRFYCQQNFLYVFYFCITCRVNHEIFVKRLYKCEDCGSLTIAKTFRNYA